MRAEPGFSSPGVTEATAAGSRAEELAAASLMLARRFAAGGTLWCWSPTWPHHAEHVAVEFVHPVIMGKRALPAVAVSDPDPLGALRASVEAGDVVVVVASSDAGAEVEEVLRRAPAWGAETVWIGAGPRPAAPSASRLVWLDEAGAEAPFSGALILVYHVLWELTHVCLEHPGLLEGPDPACDEGHCVTCSDEGTIAEVVHAGLSGSTVRTPLGTEEVDTTLVDPVEAGDLVLVHAGVAISRLDSPGGLVGRAGSARAGRAGR